MGSKCTVGVQELWWMATCAVGGIQGPGTEHTSTRNLDSKDTQIDSDWILIQYFHVRSMSNRCRSEGLCYLGRWCKILSKNVNEFTWHIVGYGFGSVVCTRKLMYSICSNTLGTILLECWPSGPHTWLTMQGMGKMTCGRIWEQGRIWSSVWQRDVSKIHFSKIYQNYAC